MADLGRSGYRDDPESDPGRPRNGAASPAGTGNAVRDGRPSSGGRVRTRFPSNRTIPWGARSGSWTANAMHVKLKNVGPITEAEADLGDLTVLVGPQASGKSVFLQTLKLAMDRDFVLHYFRRHNFVFPKLGRKNDPEIVLDAFYGDGMGGILKKNSTITFENYQDFPLQDLTHSKRTRKIPDERIFYIPEQRSIALYFGYFQPFCNFHFNNPFVLRYFSEKIDEFIRNEFESNLDPFPDNDRSTGPLNRLISKRFLGEAKLRVEPDDHAKALGLEIEGLSRQLPFLAWSAGQREFVPLLLGLHWLCPAGRVSRRNNLEWVVIEEPEM